MAANRTEGLRNMKDSKRQGVLGLPVNSKKVTRRVKPDQVSTYHMAVHERPDALGSNPLELIKDRSRDPGEVESSNLDKNSRALIAYLTAHKRASDIFQGQRRQQMGERQAGRLGIATFSKLVSLDRYEEAMDLLSTPSFKSKDLNRVSSATWRHFLKYAPTEFIDAVAQKQFPNSLFLGETAVMSNTLLRRGKNSLGYVLPATKELLKNIEYVDLPNQQLFNMSSMARPSRVEPINRNHIDIIDTAGAQWSSTKPGKSNWTRNFLKEFKGNSIRVALQGFPAKTDSSSNILQVSEAGLSNGQVQIGPEDILSVLGGFSFYPRKTQKVEDESNRDEKWPQRSLVFPQMNEGQDTLVSNVRKRLAKFSNSTSSPKNLTDSSIGVGSGIHGMSELDIREGGSYTWDNLKANSRPYKQSDESDLFTTTFPHPLVKYTAMDYLGETDASILKELGDMSVVTLPRQHLKQKKKR